MSFSLTFGSHFHPSPLSFIPFLSPSIPHPSIMVALAFERGIFLLTIFKSNFMFTEELKGMYRDIP